jgi:hypothetical protein
MKICEKCKILLRHQVMACPECQGDIKEIALREALRFTEERALQQYMVGTDPDRLNFEHLQYHIRCYLANRSLFLDFDIYKNRLKRGRKSRCFFISPVNITTIINLPWFAFNLISSNLFHLENTAYCPRCDAKHIPGRHTRDECEYNIEYFSLLDDIASGRILKRRIIYQEFARNKKLCGERCAYHDLFCRSLRWEAFWDLLSIGSTVLFWLYVAVNISLPMAQIFIQKLQYWEAYEWTFLALR